MSSVTRAFRLAVPDQELGANGRAESGRTLAFETLHVSLDTNANKMLGVCMAITTSTTTYLAELVLHVTFGMRINITSLTQMLGYGMQMDSTDMEITQIIKQWHSNLLK